MQYTVNETLRRKLLEAKERNPSCSMHSFARKIGISSGSLSSILNGHRKISKKLASRIAINLNLEGNELEQFMSSFSNSEYSQKTSTDIEYLKIEADQYNLISDWIHFGILSLMNLDHFQSNLEWMSDKLNTSLAKVKSALKRLEKINYIVKSNGKWKRSTGPITTNDNIKNLALQCAHKENSRLASLAVDQFSVEERDFSAMTMAIDRKKLKEARVLIREFQDNLSCLLENGEKKDIYKLNVQLFPLGKLEELE